MSAVIAADYARKLVDREAASAGTREKAFANLARRYGLTRAQLRHLRDGRAKTVDVGLFSRLQAAYRDIVQRQISRLEHELALERAMGGEDEALRRAEGTLAELLATTGEAAPAPCSPRGGS